jgi:hypothetical protein
MQISTSNNFKNTIEVVKGSAGTDEPIMVCHPGILYANTPAASSPNTKPIIAKGNAKMVCENFTRLR